MNLSVSSAKISSSSFRNIEANVDPIFGEILRLASKRRFDNAIELSRQVFDAGKVLAECEKS